MISLAMLAAGTLMSPALQANQTVEVPFRIADSAMIVDSVVNGKQVSAMFDSGFSGAFVLSPTVNVGKATGTMTLRDFVGEFQAPTVNITSLKFGSKNIDTTDMQVVQQDMGNMSLNYGMHCDGIMGFEVIAHDIVEINFEKQKMIFHPPSHDISKVTPDNQKTFLLKMLPKGNKSIELVAEGPGGEKMYLALDTGNAFYATTHRDVLEKLKLWPEGKAPSYMKQSWVASGPVDSWDLEMKGGKIFSVPVEHAIWNIIDLPSSSADHDGTIGFGFLRHFNITIDVQRRRVLLENFAGKVSDPPKATPGIYGFYDPGRKRVRVSRVMPNSPAAKAGIRVGDDILDINGKEMVNQSFEAIQNLLEGDAGTKVTVALSRNGELIRQELVREVLVNKLD